MAELEFKKCTRMTLAISANPERQIFVIFNPVPIMVTSQGDSKLNKVLAAPPPSPEYIYIYIKE